MTAVQAVDLYDLRYTHQCNLNPLKNLEAAAEASSLKISSHETFLK